MIVTEFMGKICNYYFVYFLCAQIIHLMFYSNVVFNALLVWASVARHGAQCFGGQVPRQVCLDFAFTNIFKCLKSSTKVCTSTCSVILYTSHMQSYTYIDLSVSKSLLDILIAVRHCLYATEQTWTIISQISFRIKFRYDEM